MTATGKSAPARVQEQATRAVLDMLHPGLRAAVEHPLVRAIKSGRVRAVKPPVVETVIAEPSP